jgi:hypothetical protein
MCNTPFNIPGGNPLTEVPWLNPRSPVMLVAPVLVIAELERTAKPDIPASCTVD